MKMKDKIYKNNHKKGYYYLKKASLSVGIFVGAFIFLAIPVSIIRSIVISPTTSLKESETKTINSDSKVNEQENISLLSF